MDVAEIQRLGEQVVGNIGKVIVGKEAVVKKLVIAMLARGHVLIEDVPGTGKTMLAKALAKSIDCTTTRVQFTPDLLPSDLTGINFFNQKTGSFEFRSGPIFTNILLADEINRATPRTQSSLLESMEERQVTIDGETHRLNQPFLVIATQNPVENQGTFPLPEAQMDRFLLQLEMGYPSTEEGLAILRRFQAESPFDALAFVVPGDQVNSAADAIRKVRVHDDVLRYLLTIVEATRVHSDVLLGVSPRGSQALLRCAQAAAALSGRDFVTPDDVKSLAVDALAHRLTVSQKLRRNKGSARSIIEEILHHTPVPTETYL